MPVGASCSACRGLSSSALVSFPWRPRTGMSQSNFRHALEQLQTNRRAVATFVRNSSSLSYRQRCRRQHHCNVVAALCTTCQLWPAKATVNCRDSGPCSSLAREAGASRLLLRHAPLGYFAPGRVAKKIVGDRGGSSLLKFPVSMQSPKTVANV